LSPSTASTRWSLRASYALLLAVTSFGLFTSLDDRLLWGDEAETALLAQSVLQFGVPRVDDGRNLVGHLGVRDSNDAGIWIWSPWLDEYVVAASFALAGPSTFSARFPFALAGLACVALLGWIAYRVYRSHELALAAMALLATCVPFLLHARQARYYALAMLAMLLMLFGFQQLVEKNRNGAFPIALALTVLFYSNYVIVPGSVLGLLAAGALLLRSDRNSAVALLLAIAGFGVLALPWLLYAGFGEQAATLSTQRVLPNLVYYLSEIHFHVVPWVVFALPLFALVNRSSRMSQPTPAARRGREIELAIGLIVLAQLLVLSLSPFRFFRYLTPLLPLLTLVAAAVLHRWLQPAWLRRALVVLLCAGNWIAVASAYPLSDQHPAAATPLHFGTSLLHDYRNRLEDVVSFLNTEASDGQSLVVADPEFPLAFYTELRVRDARRAGEWPPPPPYPEWILPLSASGIAVRPPLQLPAQLRASYRELLIETRRSRRGGTRPDPHAYEYFRSEETEALTLYQLR
jgi:4-amino-4-deoxy-L-arabinose transferase-like glycosyltransferase